MLSASQSGYAQEAPSKDFDEYVNKALKDWDVPGLAIAIVKNDQVVFAKGYGVRKLGDPAPVDDKTLFAIGSSSKAFTSASIAMLVDEGKLKLDDPATKYLPGFQLFDPTDGSSYGVFLSIPMENPGNGYRKPGASTRESELAPCQNAVQQLP